MRTALIAFALLAGIAATAWAAQEITATASEEAAGVRPVENARLVAVFTARRQAMEQAANRSGLPGLLNATGTWPLDVRVAAACDHVFDPDIQLNETQPRSSTTVIEATAAVDPSPPGFDQNVEQIRNNTELMRRYAQLYSQEQAILNQTSRLKEQNVALLSELFKGGDPMKVSAEREKLRRRFQEDSGKLKAIGWRRKALGLLRRGAYDSPRRALDYFDKAIAAHPSAVEPYVERGVVHAQLEEWGQAYRDYSRALQLEPDLAKAHNNRGLALERLGKSHQAILDFDRALNIDPRYVAAYVNRGNAYLALNQPLRALADYEKALRIAPRNAPALVNRANANLRLGNLQAALRDYNRAIELAPGLAKAWDNRGVLHHKLGEDSRMCRDFA
ncbi:MAG: tetratricopeptide repeat protein, partial [Desulfovibrionaceae bacterium]